MKAAVLYAHGAPLEIEEVETDGPREGEVLVRMVASGICHSDRNMQLGVHPAPLPAILGHEGAGIVEEVGPGVRNAAPGDHVVLSWLPYCGHCRWCSGGRSSLCENVDWSENGTMRDGSVHFHRNGRRIHHFLGTSSFAELSVVPAESVIVVDKTLPLTRLCVLGCAVMTGVGAVLNTARVRPGETVAVFGCGGVGLDCIQGAVIAGAARIVAIDREPAKLALARQLGATDVLDPRDGDAVERLRDLYGGVDHAFEAIGRKETIEQSVRATGRGGQAILVGMAPPETEISFAALAATMEERTIKGSWYGSTRPAIDFPALVNLFSQGRLRLDLMIEYCSLGQRYLKGMEQGGGAFRRRSRRAAGATGWMGSDANLGPGGIRVPAERLFFDPQYMTALYQVGYERALVGTAWQNVIEPDEIPVENEPEPYRRDPMLIGATGLGLLTLAVQAGQHSARNALGERLPPYRELD